ncbi:glucosidase 2 subunit beta isoform X1 [Gossypium raimondii]|nr:glucosidase 2 subunit beta isoform X1 [Gossypium raimondii]
MKQRLSLMYLSFILIISSRESSSSIPSNSFIGIPPQDEDYFKREIIKCKNGSKKFTKAQLNDDFCDCPDGTDEPGTSACPLGKFYCKNIGHAPSFQYSSRVNDGICDCCDGSDEYDGKVKCPYTCHEAGKVAMESLKRKIEVYQEGVILRKVEIGLAKRAIARDKAELSGLKNEREVVEKVVHQLEGQVRKLEQEPQEKDDKMREARNEKVENEESGPDKNVDSQIEPMKASDVEKQGQAGESLSDQNEKDEHESSEGLSREELGRLVESRWTGKKSGEQVEETDPVKNDQEEGGPDAEYEESVADNAGRSSTAQYKIGVQDLKNSSDIATPSGKSWLDKIQETAQNFLQSVNFFSIPVANLDANKIRKEYNHYTAKLSDLESRISSLTEKLKFDFGKQNEFYLFYDRCFELKQDKYVYKVCPFRNATQEDGSSETQLGIWEKFGNSYRLMLFTNGEGCWNGPDRSLKVKLRCGLKTELTGVDEPSRCEYAAFMYTPLLCLDEKLEEFKQKLESMNQEKPRSHDEL